MNEYLSVKTASQIFDISQNTLRAWIRDRKIPVYKFRNGSKSIVRLKRKDIENMFERIESVDEIYKKIREKMG